MIPASRALPALALALLVVTTGCRRNRETAAPTPAPADVMPSTPMTPGIDAEAARRDSLARESERQRLMMEEARASLLAAVYFDYDRDELTESGRMALDAKVPILSSNPSIRLRISGHTDARGSDEYNLSLGLRRAAAVKRYLAQFGISDDRLETMSAGEERPAVQGDGEDVWAMNRRAEFDMIGGEIRAGAGQ